MAPQLITVLIRARSSLQIRQLRHMAQVDVVRVRPDPGRQPDEDALSPGGFLVEAIVPREIVAALKGKGFDIAEVPADR
jgi:hypothetical protein